MYKCREASTKEIIAFQKEFCENLSAAIGMNDKHRVQVESYEELPPWSFVYNADGSDRFLKDDIIMLKVCDLEKRIVYYPVFPEKRGLKLLQCWDMAVPPKLTAFEQEGKQEGNVHRANQSLRNLIAFARLFMLSQSRWHKPMAYSFNNMHIIIGDILIFFRNDCLLFQLHNLVKQMYQYIINNFPVLHSFLSYNVTTLFSIKHSSKYLR